MNKKIIVRSVLGTLIIIFSSLFWLLLFGALNNGPDWLAKSLWGLAAFLFLGVTLGLAYLLENSKHVIYVLPLLVLLPALIFLPESLATGIVAALALAFLALGVWRADFEKSLRIEFIPWIVLRKSLGYTITALALITTLFFYWSPFTRSLEEKIFIPRPLFDAVSQPVAEVFLRLSFQPGTDADLSSPEFKRQQNKFFDELYRSANEQLSLAGKTLKKWLPLGVSVSLFFTFKIIGTILSFLIIALAWLIFRVLLLSGVVKITKIAVEKEIIII